MIPTEPGWYWATVANTGKREVVYVDHWPDKPTMWVQVRGIETRFLLDSFVNWSAKIEDPGCSVPV